MDGIVISPDNQVILFAGIAMVTLYSEQLPVDCKKFWLWEETVEPYAFAGVDISRGDNDEYWIEVISVPY